jgi:hypothetical protein
MPPLDGSDPYGDFLRQATLRHEAGPALTGRGLPIPDRLFDAHSGACVSRFLTAVVGSDKAKM